MDFTGRAAIVTGGARGLGAAVAERLAAARASVAIVDIDEMAARAEAESINAVGGKAYPLHVDVTRSESVRDMVQAVLERQGRVDILVNNAGIGGHMATVIECTDEEWQRVLDVDLNGVFRCTRAVLPRMIEHGYGRIVNIASIAGKEGNPYLPAYTAAKAGVIGLTKAVAKGVAAQGVLVNAITPGRISDSKMNAEYSAEDWKTFGAFVPRIPLERMASPQEVAALVVWLCSDECSYSTGAIFDVSGGRASY